MSNWLPSLNSHINVISSAFMVHNDPLRKLLKATETFIREKSLQSPAYDEFSEMQNMIDQLCIERRRHLEDIHQKVLAGNYSKADADQAETKFYELCAKIVHVLYTISVRHVKQEIRRNSAGHIMNGQ